jgi:hypothetical protein
MKRPERGLESQSSTLLRASFSLLFVVSLYIVGITTAYSSGFYFLLPYYSIQPGEQQYEEPVILDWVDGSYLLTLKTVTTKGIAIHDLDVDLAIRAIFRANHTISRSCPPNFASSYAYGGPCEYVQHAAIDFIGFSTDTLTGDTAGLTERPATIAEFLFTFTQHDAAESEWDHRIPFTIELLRVDNDIDDCTSVEDCKEFIAKIEKNEEDIHYDSGSYSCIPKDPHSPHSYGCAVRIHLGTEKECFPDKSNFMKCDFAVYWNFFVKPGEVYMARGMWLWGTLVFIPCLACWVVLGLIHSRFFHIQYLRLYYLSPALPAFRKGETYDLKMVLVGQQFTKCKGLFRIYTTSPDPVFQFPINAVFGEEEVEGEKMAQLMLREEYEHREDDCLAKFNVTWTHDFISADAIVPLLKLEVRRKIPVRVKTRWNIGLVSLFCLIGLLFRRPPPSSLLHYKKYLLLVLYNVSVHLSWILVVCFTVISFSSHTTGAHPLVWGSMERRPWGSLFFAILFIVIVFLSLALNLLCIATLGKTQLITSYVFGILSSSKDIDSQALDMMLDASGAGMPVTSPRNTGLKQDCSTLEFVPLSPLLPPAFASEQTEDEKQSQDE